MRVLIAPDSFGSTLGATQVAAAMARGWAAGAARDQLTLMPLCGGGPGFLDVLERALGGTMLATTVSDPLGRQVPAAVLVTQEGGRRTAYVEAAQANGLHLLHGDERDPTLTSTWGVGQLVATALEQGVTRVVIGLGSGSTNDAGAGLLAALGAGPASVLARGGLALRDAGPDALPGLPEVRQRLGGVELVFATDEETALLGLRGTSAVESPRKGATPEQSQALESALGHFTDLLARSLPAPGLDLISGTPRRLDREPGAGACGGLGYALLALGARPVGAVAEVLRLSRFPDAAAQTDLVVTGTERLDWTSVRGSVVSGVAEAAQHRARPVVCIAGETLLGRRETMTMGLAGCYAVAEGPRALEALLADPVSSLVARTARVARTWSPAR